jgi:hypothetical protein
VKPAIARRLLAALFVVTAFVAGCRDGMPTGPNPIPPGSGRLSVVAQFELNTATNLVIEVSAPDIPQTLVFNLEIVNGTASGSVTIPAGSNRLIVVRAFDGKTETHRGSRSVTIVEGVNAPLSLTLLPLAGTVPVTVSFGVAVVSVTPLTWSLPVDSTVAFAATVMDATGAMEASPIVRWASTDTRKLTIDSTGLATARDTGTVMVVAVSGGAAARSTVTITPNNDTTIPPSFVRTWVGGDGSGSSQTSWINPNNWTPAAVPTANDSVVIGAASFQPALPGVDTLRVRDLTLLPGANLTMNFRVLTVVGGSLAGLGGTTNAGSGGTIRLLGNARLSGNVNVALQVQGSGTVTLADSARVPSIAISGTSTVLDLAGRKLVITSTGTALNVFTEGLLRMNNPADTLDVAGNVFIQGSAAPHAGNLTAGTFIVRGNISDGSRYDASGTHRTVFAGNVATITTQSVSGFDNTSRPTNALQDVVIEGSSAWSNCNPRLLVRGSFSVASPITTTHCTTYTMEIDGPLSTVAGSNLNLYSVVLDHVSGTAGVAGALSTDFLTFSVQNAQLRVGLAYRALIFQRSVSISDSIRTIGPVTIDGVGSAMDIATPAGRAATFASLTINNGATLTMAEATDSLVVAGTMTANSSADLSLTLTAGTLRVGGAISGSNFGATGSHLTVLDGVSSTTWQDLNGFDSNSRPTNGFRNLTIANSGLGARNCFSNVRITGAFRVVGASTYSTCSSNFTRVDSLVATDAGTTVNAYGFTLANANGTQDVFGTWTPGFTDFVMPNQPVRANLDYQALRFFASNTLPAGVAATASILVDGTTTVLAFSNGRATTAAFTTQSGARFAMDAGDTLRVTGAVNLSGGLSAPSGGVLEIEAAFNGSGYAPIGTHELRLRGAGAHGLSGFSDRPLPTLRIVSGTAAVNFMNLVVQDSLLMAAGTSLNTATTNFVIVRGRLQTAVGSTMVPHGVTLEGTATLQLVDGGFAPTVVRVAGPGTGPGTVLRNAPEIQYTNVEFYTSYALSDSLMLSGYAYASGAGVVLDFNGRKIRAPTGLNFDANATGRMVNAADTLIVGNGANGTQSLLWDSGTSGTVNAGTIMVFGGSTTMSSFVATGTNRVVYTDTAFAASARTSVINGTATFNRLTIRGQGQFTVSSNSNTITVSDSLRVESGTLLLNFAVANVDGAGQAVLYVGPTAVLSASSSGTINLHSPTGTSLVSAGATFSPALTRFWAANPTVNPALDYQNVDFYGPVTFSGNTNIAGYLYAQNAGAGVNLGGHRVNVGNYVDMGTNAFLVMTSAADTLDVGADLAIDGGVPSIVTDGVVLFRGNTFTGTNYNAVVPHRTVFLGTTGAPQNVNGNTAFGRVEVAGGRGFNANFSTYTVADSFVVSTGVPIVSGGGSLTINGPMVASVPIAISVADMRLRHATGTQNLPSGTTFSSGTITLSEVSGLPTVLRDGLTYNNVSIQAPVTLAGSVGVAGNLSIGGGLNPTLTLAGNTVTVGGAVTVANAGRLFMTNAADLLRTTGTADVNFQATAGTGSLTAGTLEVSGDFIPQSNGHAMSGAHRVLLVRDNTTQQVISSNGTVPINNLEIGGTGSRTIQFQQAQTVAGTFSVTSPAVVTINQNSTWQLTVDGAMSGPATATWSIPGILRVNSASGLDNLAGNVTVGTLVLGGTALNQTVPTDARYVIGNLTVPAGASATIGAGTRRIGSGTSGTISVSGVLTIPDGSTLQGCSSANSGLAGGSAGLPGTIQNVQSGGAPLLLRMPGPIASTTFGANAPAGVLSGVNVQFNITAGC